MKKFLFIMRRVPQRGFHVQETLDMILTTAAFDQAVSVLFVDDGVLQLKKQQSATFMGLKDIAAIFQALEVYDVKELYVEQESLQARALTEQDLILSVKLLARSEITALIKLFDVVVPD